MHAGTRRQQAALEWGDGVAAAALAIGTLLYLWQWPYNLGSSDEGIYLYQAKRLLDGDVFFRDIFDIIPPGAHYLMASAFGLFGTSMGTARAVNAVMHAAIVVGLYASARLVGTGIALALLPPVAHLALCQAPWPFASPHWLASTLTTATALVALRGGWREHPRSAIGVGAIIGTLIMVQQQKGALIAAGMNGVALLLSGSRGLLPLRMQLLYVNAGIAAVVVPAFTLLAVQSGVGPIYYALVQHTFGNYRHHHSTDWGSVPLLTEGFAAYTFPRLLKYSPLILLPEALRALRSWWIDRDIEAIRASVTLIGLGLAAVASIAYFPDFIHVGFIAGTFCVVAVGLLDRALHVLAGKAHWIRHAPLILAVGAIAALAVQLERNLARSQREFPVTAETAFGRIAFPDSNQPSFVDTADRLLAPIPSREMFTYPFYASLYLMTNAKNPTPYQFLFPDYSGPAQIQEVIDILDARRVPLVFAFHAFVPKDDQLLAYIRTHYVPADPHQLFWTRRSE